MNPNDPMLALRIEQHSKSWLSGALTAITNWPAMLSADAVIAEARKNYWDMFHNAPAAVAQSLLPIKVWESLYVQGYRWQFDALEALWGLDNWKLKEALQ